MSLDRIQRNALVALTLTTFGSFEAGAQTMVDQATIGTWRIPPVTHQRASVQSPDGTTFIGGDFSLDAEDCPRAFLHAQGRRNWAHTQASFFAEFSSFDPAFVVSSSLHDLDIDTETGEVLTTGEVTLTWQDPDGSGDLVMARGAFIAVLDADGNLSREVYLGALPEGPASDSKACSVLCELGRSDPRPQNGGRCIAADGRGGLVAVAWRQGNACDPATPKDRDLWITRFFGKSLATPDWQVTAGTSGDDTCTAVTFGEAGEIYLTGDSHSGDRDLLVAKLDENGTVKAITTINDPGDGGGETLTASGEGVAVTGFINGQIEFAGEILGDADTHEIVALFDPQLQPISATTIDPPPGGEVFQTPFANKSSQLPPPDDPPHPDGHLGEPIAVIVAAGETMAGGLKELESSDNRYMNVQAIDHAIRLFVYFDPGPEPVFLDSISLEMRTQSCYTATVFLNRENSSEFEVLGQRGMCPTNEPVLSVEIPREASIALGYDAVNPNPDWRLRVGVILEFPEPPPQDPGSCILFSQSAQEANVDEVKIEVEY